MSKEYRPTPADLAKAAERRRLKQERAQNKPIAVEPEQGCILQRNWLEVSPANAGQTVRFMTWNVSSVCLGCTC